VKLRFLLDENFSPLLTLAVKRRDPEYPLPPMLRNGALYDVVGEMTSPLPQ